MKKRFTFIYWTLALLVTLGVSSCSEEDDAYDAYANWPARNADYFMQVAAQARTAIAEAKTTYGDEWESHCEWRMYKSTNKAPMAHGGTTDSICVKIEQRGVGEESPKWSDTVRVHYRGTLMPVQNVYGEKEEKVFSQSYIGELNPAVAVPVKMGVSDAVAGFATALQYMHVGDSWCIYMPAELAYGAKESGTVLPYSTLTFRVNMAAFYKAGTTVPEWK